MLQLNPPLELETPKGCGWCHFATWNSIEHSIYWTVFLHTGEIWTFPNEQVRACKNITADRPKPSTPVPASAPPTLQFPEPPPWKVSRKSW